ncbi:MAG TPA: ParB/Srx family N-terminal domain-containing protein [Bdellovibrionota bacterium]|nr:ParB/Srx family N-terminal domain-containing protein [Bdellovibrionota bacterium]
MKSFRTVLLLALVMGLASPSTGLAAAGLAQQAAAIGATIERQRLWVPIDLVRPTQTHIGRENVQVSGDDMVKEAGSRPMDEYLRKRFASNPLPAVRGPDGKFYLTDGHHRATAIEEIYRDLVPGKQAEIHILVIRDFKAEGADARTFASWMLAENKAYIAPEVRERARRETGMQEPTPEVLFERYIPKTFRALADSPMRSAVGNVLHGYDQRAKAKKVPFKTEQLKEYIEFLIGEKLTAEGITVEEGAEREPETVKRIEAALYRDPSFLRESYRRMVKRDDLTEANRQAVSAMVNFMQADYESRNPRHIEAPAPAPAGKPVAPAL